MINKRLAWIARVGDARCVGSAGVAELLSQARRLALALAIYLDRWYRFVRFGRVLEPGRRLIVMRVVPLPRGVHERAPDLLTYPATVDDEPGNHRVAFLSCAVLCVQRP